MLVEEKEADEKLSICYISADFNAQETTVFLNTLSQMLFQFLTQPLDNMMTFVNSCILLKLHSVIPYSSSCTTVN
jgi:hypothetical protein